MREKTQARCWWFRTYSTNIFTYTLMSFVCVWIIAGTWSFSREEWNFVRSEVRKVHEKAPLIMSEKETRTCPSCLKVFPRRVTLERHFAEVCQRSAIPCPHCPFSTKHEKNMDRRHIKHVHNIGPPRDWALYQGFLVSASSKMFLLYWNLKKKNTFKIVMCHFFGPSLWRSTSGVFPWK